MRTLRYLLAIALICGLTGMAKADDFQMVILDPSYATNIVTTTDFAFNFVPCVAGEPVGAEGTYEGCFAGINGTGEDITSILMEITPLIGSQTAGCALDGNTDLNIFQNVTCSTNANGYLLDFTGGDITQGENFVIAENGVDVTDPTNFPTVNAMANTPEPNSFWLLSTGVLAMGFFFTQRRLTVRAIRAK